MSRTTTDDDSDPHGYGGDPSAPLPPSRAGEARETAACDAVSLRTGAGHAIFCAKPLGHRGDHHGFDNAAKMYSWLPITPRAPAATNSQPAINPAQIDSAALETTDVAYLRRLSVMLERVDWEGGSIGAAAIGDAADTIATLRAQALAGAEDTARLNWLEEYEVRVSPIEDDDAAYRGFYVVSAVNNAESARPMLRDAIDAGRTPERAV